METYRLRHFRQVLGDRYEFQAFLGRGAFASVYLVQNLKLKRREALKILADTYQSDSTARFVAEAQLVASLDHPNIVQVYDYGEVEGVIWYSMQYIEGPMLRDEMWARRRFDAISAVRVAIPLLGALAASHRRGIVHRDIKPSNVILNATGRPYLMDFGIAKADDGHLKTTTGGVLGTPAFMAPEQAEGKPLDGRADLYSLGLVLYQMLAGRSPWETQEPVQLLLLRLREDPPRLATLVPDIDPDLETILMKMLARDREERFPSAEELERHLISFLGGEGRDLPPFELVAPVLPPEPLEPDSAPALNRPMSSPEAGSTVPFEPKAGTPPNPATGRPWQDLVTGWAFGVGAILTLAAVALFGRGWIGGERKAETTPSRQMAPVSPTSAKAPGSTANPSAPETQDEKGVEGRGTVEPAATTSLPAKARLSPRLEPLPRREAAPPSAASASVVSLTDVALVRRPTQPRLIQEVETSLEGDAVALCAGTSVMMTIDVGQDGRPTNVRLHGKSPAACGASAEAAARQYRFDPALDAQERPMAAKVTLAISFGELQ